MGEKNLNFERGHERQGPTFHPEKEQEKPTGLKQPAKVRRRPLGTKEDYAISEKSKSEKPGHLAEQAICDWLKKAPGVSDARLSSDIEDSEKVDIFVQFHGDSEPVKLQVSMNPKKTAENLPPDVSLIKFRPEDIQGKEISPFLQKKIAKKIIQRMPFDKMGGLFGYHGID